MSSFTGSQSLASESGLGQRKSPQSSTQPHDHPYKVIFVIGGPGAGKGTLCGLLAAQLGYMHLSAGDYLRDLARRGMDPDPAVHPPAAALGGLTAAELQHKMDNSELITEATIVDILRFQVDHAHETYGLQGIIIDGFPRNLNSAMLWQETIGRPALALRIDCQRNTALQRYLGRARERADSVQRHNVRYEQYLREAPAIEAWFTSQGLLRTVNNEGNLSQAHAYAYSHVASAVKIAYAFGDL